MTTTIEAVYERGVLRLKEALPLAEGTPVEVTVALPETEQIESPAVGAMAVLPAEHDDEERLKREHYRNLRAEYEKQATKTPQEVAAIMESIATMPLEGDTDDFSGRDHDKILYGDVCRKHGA